MSRFQFIISQLKRLLVALADAMPTVNDPFGTWRIKNGNLAISQHDAIASPNESLNSFLGFSFSIVSPGLFARIRAMV